MNQTDASFMEIFKKMDGVFKQRYGSSDGISSYLDRMDAVDGEGREAISSWNDDRFALRNFRFLYSRIVQEYGRAFCAESDLHAILRFYGRVLEAKDPLSLLEKAKGEKEALPVEGEAPNDGAVPERKARGGLVWLSAAAVVILALIIVVLLLVR